MSHAPCGTLRFEDAAGRSQAPSPLHASMGTIWDTTEGAVRVTCPTQRDAESVAVGASEHSDLQRDGSSPACCAGRGRAKGP
jgi:hypothetical protein